MAEPSMSLCFSCARAVASLCPWLARGDRTGLVYTSRIARCPRWGEEGTIELVTVTDCPRYRKGPVPPLDRRTFAGPGVGRILIPAAGAGACVD